MVDEFEVQAGESVVLLFGLWKESDIQVCGLDVNSSGFCRVEVQQGFCYIVNGVWVFQSLAQLDHSV